MAQQLKNYIKLGDSIHARIEKVNSELLALTYGSLVIQLLKDFENVEAVNTQLERMGASMGSRMIEEFLAKISLGICSDFKETMEVLSKVGFRMFLGITADVTDWNVNGSACSLIFSDNPLVDFVELPPTIKNDLNYSSLICGVIRGALEQLYIRVSCQFIKDVLKGDHVNEIRIELKELLKDEFVTDDSNVNV